MATIASAYENFKPNATVAKYLNDYVNQESKHYSWFDTGLKFQTKLGSTAYKLNVTSLQWLDDSYYKIKDGSSIWTHEVVVIEPKHTLYRNVSFVYLSSLHARCNDEEPITGSTFDIEMADAVAVDSKSLAVVLH